MPRFKFGLNLSPLPIIVIFIGICVAVWGGKEALLASGAAEKPQDIVCADLAADGPGNNTHVRVTNFYSVGNFVYRKSPNGDWQTAWFAIVPPSAAKVPRGKRVLRHVVSPDIVDPSQIKVLIKSRTVRSQEQLESVMNRDSIEGLVINRIEKLTDLERQQLQDAFPAANMDQVCIVEDGRQPAGGSGLLALVGGGLLILGGLILIFRPVS